jgi:hypothetical protein
VGAHYTLFNLVTNTEEPDIHVSQIKPFEYDPVYTNPVDVARADAGEYVVEAILAHSGDPRRRSFLDFLVRWKGYDESEDLWLPWKSIRLNSKLHEYLRANGMGRLVPK